MRATNKKKNPGRSGTAPGGRAKPPRTGPAALVEMVERVRDLEAALRLQTERAERAGGDRCRLVLEVLPDAVCLCSGDGTVRYANPACAAMFGSSGRDLAGRSLPGLLAECGCRDGERLLAGDAPTPLVLELPGLGRVMEFSRTPLPGDEVILSGREAADRERREQPSPRAGEKTLPSDRAKEEFFANVSHELRTPISAIIGMAECMLDTRDAAVQADFAGKVKECAESLLAVVSDILDYASLLSNKLELDVSSFAPAAFLSESLMPFMKRARAKGLQFGLEVDPSTPTVLEGDVRRLGRVLTHLAANAVTFTEQGAVHVSVAPYHRPGWVRFAVSDTGVGIAKDKLDMIFKDFTQSDQGLSKRYPGLGLGLAVCRGLVRLMGGDIEVRSRPGEGSCFSFAVPASKGEEAPGSAAAPAAGPLSILHVEDNELNREFMNMLLTRMGHEVDEAYNGFVALEKLAEKKYDLVIMDLQLPGMDGVEALRRIRSGTVSNLDPSVPVVALTAFATEGDRERMIQEGMTDYLQKPVDRRRLESLLAGIAGGGGTVADNFRGMFTEQADAEKLKELFKRQAPQSMAEIDAALECGDMDMAARRAHYLAGSALAVGNRELAELARDMVQAARQGNKAACDACWDGLRRAFDWYLRSKPRGRNGE